MERPSVPISARARTPTENVSIPSPRPDPDRGMKPYRLWRAAHWIRSGLLGPPQKPGDREGGNYNHTHDHEVHEDKLPRRLKEVTRAWSPLSRLTPPRFEIHLAELAVARRRPVSALAAVTRMPVLRSGVAQAVAVDVA